MSEKKSKGLPIEECIRRARAFIALQGKCLLLYDVAGSRAYWDDWVNFIARLKKMHADMLRDFGEYFPENNLRVLIEQDRGFVIIRGDTGVAGIDDAEIIRDIIEYQREHYGDINFYWSVAQDGYDDEGFSHIY